MDMLDSICEEKLERTMHHTVFQILFLGENPSWMRVTNALAEAPAAPLRIHRSDSPSDLLRVLAEGYWDALAIDLHAWSFQGLRVIQKIRAEYPAIPVLALLYPSVKDLDKKAQQAGASHCLPLNQLSADLFHSALLEAQSEQKAQVHLRKADEMDLAVGTRTTGHYLPNRMEAIAHTLNNLLCVISANADLLADQIAGSEPAVHNVEEIKKAAKSASDLMNNLK